MVVEIDGLPTTRPVEPKRIAVGKHVLGLQIIRFRTIMSGYIDLEAKPNREYTLNAVNHSMGCFVTLRDTTDKANSFEIKTIKILW